MQPNSPIYVVGDVHGQFEKLTGILRHASLIDGNLRWAAGPATLWFMGDFVDRGPDGIGVIDLVMRLQSEAPAVGGKVHALIGNHEPLLLAAQRFGDQPAGGPGGSFRADWERNGGVATDLQRLTPEHIDWISNLPAMAHVGDRLFVHADATFYGRYGRSVDKVNQAFRAILHGRNARAFDKLLGDFSERLHFDGRHTNGVVQARQFLKLYGGRQIVHGHTPIFYVDQLPPDTVRGARVYAQGLCVNVDGGMYAGGPGFVYELPPRIQISAYD